MNSREQFSDTKSQKSIEHFLHTRKQSEAFCQPLEVEDYGLQAIAETSPAKWHLAHTSWFFETFILKPYEKGFKHFQSKYEYLFNSYYNGVGEQFLRSNRGLLSRPTVKEVYQYRENITQRIAQLLNTKSNDSSRIQELLILGINHEQQHQELFFTDLLFNWYQNPLLPVYQKPKQTAVNADFKDTHWLSQKGGLTTIGANDVSNEFIFDNESPQHQCFLNAFEIQNRLVTNQEFLEFIQDSGYKRPEFWLSDGWAAVQQHQWQAPLYWQNKGNRWYQYGLNGLNELEMAAPVCHISAYEADAYARWYGARLPTEAEWESVAQHKTLKQANFVESMNLAPLASESEQFFGDVWEWTSSAYSPYPGFKAPEGAVGEYNGKFMCNQLVLKGGSCVTSHSHIRSSYRNFFYPEARWQFSGLRLARDL